MGEKERNNTGLMLKDDDSAPTDDEDAGPKDKAHNGM
jgi:hypothetical protein